MFTCLEFQMHSKLLGVGGVWYALRAAGRGLRAVLPQLLQAAQGLEQGGLLGGEVEADEMVDRLLISIRAPRVRGDPAARWP